MAFMCHLPIAAGVVMVMAYSAQASELLRKLSVAGAAEPSLPGAGRTPSTIELAKLYSVELDT